MLSTLVLFLMFIRVYSGMNRWRPAHSRKMMSKTMKTMRILFAIVAAAAAAAALPTSCQAVKPRYLQFLPSRCNECARNASRMKWKGTRDETCSLDNNGTVEVTESA
jgi:hypothetical protein